MSSRLRRNLRRPARFDDLHALSPTEKGEIIDGELFVQPWGLPAHANALGGVITSLAPARGEWWLLFAPGIQHVRAPEYSPDVAAWRRDRMPRLPSDEPMRVVPDWVCEVIMTPTRGYDTVIKRRFYAAIGVAWAWYVDLEARYMSASRLQGGLWHEFAVHAAEEKVRLEPFPEVEIDLASWWDAG